ncbi:FIST N-terminal domain-containing protein [Dechloromonas sp. ZS-1]|uniref:FIST signal transduction protein n=1 Tax=Dechloromonas sp. ZS-1 TaxID=3138067 RepID=UPI0031FCBF5D
MKTLQTVITQPDALGTALSALVELKPDWIQVFGSLRYLTQPDFVPTLRAAFPDALLTGCSTAGEIAQDGVHDDACVVNAVRFDSVTLRCATTKLAGMDDSGAAGVRLGTQLQADDLRAVMVWGPGVAINGSALVDGMASVLGPQVPLTGGLAGDGGAFAQTWTLGPAGVQDDQVVAIGFAGEALRFGHGSFGGWEPFGPARKVTRAVGNILYELDGAPALDVYKRYLGDYAKDLPASGLLFPFAMLGTDHDETGLIRTILAVSETDGSLTLAGEIIEGGYLKLMHASTDRLVDGAEAAAEATQAMLAAPDGGLAILVSCVGRKLVMGARVDEEVEAVGDVLGQGACLTGFYSYGEISPFAPGVACKLHNQTMTITYLGED